jgi:RNA polymerase subunit RPABC4/transcription elongation factor Spt4
MEKVIIQTESSQIAQNFAAEIQKIHKGEITLN